MLFATAIWVPSTRWLICARRADKPRLGPWPLRLVSITPTANTGDALVAAYLWVKIPGESDGACNRWAPAGSADPVRGYLDPAAGVWFPAAALELTANASPSL